MSADRPLWPVPAEAGPTQMERKGREARKATDPTDFLCDLCALCVRRRLQVVL